MAYINKSYSRKKNDRYEEDSLHAIGAHLDSTGLKIMAAQAHGHLAELAPEDAINVIGGIMGGAAKPKDNHVMVSASLIRPKGSKETIDVADSEMACKLLDLGGTFVGEKMVKRQVSTSK